MDRLVLSPNEGDMETATRHAPTRLSQGVTMSDYRHWHSGSQPEPKWYDNGGWLYLAFAIALILFFVKEALR